LRTYLATTGTIFGLFSAGHVFELIVEWRPPASDPGFALGLVAIILVSGALSAWAFRLFRAAGPAAA
jgi:hypothetical protein